MQTLKGNRLKKPEWLKKKLRYSAQIHEVKTNLRSRSLHTVCESAKCPNICECFEKNRAAFMIMGDICTRNCGFCAVKTGNPLPLNRQEPERIARMSVEMRLNHVVITSVTRDDLPDGGAHHFSATIKAIRNVGNSLSIEVLTPDFNGNEDALKTVLNTRPDVFNHNLETVEVLSQKVRSGANYQRSLSVLRFARGYATTSKIKSGIMVGLGETDSEILKTLDDLAAVGCNIVTIGQYLRPSMKNSEVKRYVKPEKFEEYKKYGEVKGIDFVFAGPLVRSSYMADSSFDKLRMNGLVHGEPHD